jgi:hypothetical protein
LANERRDAERQRIEQHSAATLSNVEGRIRTAEARVSAQRWQFWTRITGFFWVIVEAALRFKGMGRAGRPRSAEAAMRGMATERGQHVSAQASLDKLLDEKRLLEAQRDKTLANLDGKYRPDQLPLERLVLKPRKTDIEIDRVSLVWLPYRIDAQDMAQVVYLSPDDNP